jgi:hypothetical protein
VVQAPAERVWELLMNPFGYGEFWDLTIERLEPSGPATTGQKFVGVTRGLCREWEIVGEVVEVDVERRQIHFRTMLPLGLVGDNRISCTPIDAKSCVLRYG